MCYNYYIVPNRELNGLRLNRIFDQSVFVLLMFPFIFPFLLIFCHLLAFFLLFLMLFLSLLLSCLTSQPVELFLVDPLKFLQFFYFLHPLIEHFPFLNNFLTFAFQMLKLFKHDLPLRFHSLALLLIHFIIICLVIYFSSG